jgi:hypothetical protein
MDALIHDAFPIHTNNGDDEYTNIEDMDPGAFTSEHNVQQSEEGDDSDKFYKLLKEAEQNLYPGCKKFSKLSFIVHLYHLKCLNGWTDKSFSMLLELLSDAFPEENTLPKSFYETKKIISGLGLSYEKIHVCPNECILYWRDWAHANVCPKCGLSRWKVNSDDVEGRKKIPEKVLRWFPLKARLQRLFMSSKTASFMTWHENSRTKDGLMRHPADSFAWKDFDRRYPNFSCDPRNVRLGLASDGFNPFKTMTISHSTWPVVLIPYNLPPWMCMKQPNFILSLLIPGQRNGKKYCPRACYQMTSNEKESFLEVLKNLKAPDEYLSSIPRCVQVKQRKIFGLKSYDCHLLMQEFLPIAMKGCLPDKVSKVISDLCNFFKELCGKVLSEHNLENLEHHIAETLCQLEKIFPPSFFTVMVHLVIHLAYEAKVAGPVHYRWMYPIERYGIYLVI